MNWSSFAKHRNDSPVRVRFEHDAEAVLLFLDAIEYPYRDSWSVEMLRRDTIMLRLETKLGGLVGYAWGHFVEEYPETLVFHFAIVPLYRGRWLNRYVLADLLKLVEFIGAKQLACKTENDVINRFLTRLGFTERDGILFKIL